MQHAIKIINDVKKEENKQRKYEEENKSYEKQKVLQNIMYLKKLILIKIIKMDINNTIK